ncbi:nucleotide disphospho-sugar-binding domain-containing protein [Saccharopolyspora sp. CA-218241]|uniref:nucleotide disphospho-sugar-binding domain-containing protein n=1 Tax=Saccharopolyspora sp. CA-218241 TaxID=3240027 RepID=UPI003D97782E
MRALFLSTPHAKDVFPMVPLAWALRASGHEVAIATSGPALDHGSGLPTIDFGPADPKSAEVIPLADEHRRMVWTRLDTVEEGWTVLAQVASTFADPMIDVARQWRPDLVVHSQLQGGGALAGAALGVPAVEHGFGLLRSNGFYEALPDLLPGTMDRLGLDSAPVPRAVVDIAPPSMVRTQDRAWPTRFVPYNGPGALPGWLHEEGPPRIALTIGSMGLIGGPDRDADPFVERFLDRIASAAGKVTAELLLIGIDPRHPGVARLPGNVRVLTGWIPLRELLGHCSAIVHQGGAGTMLNALEAGLPQFTVPAVAPNYIHSVAMQERGVGWWSELDELDAAVFERLVEDTGLATAAAEVRAEIAAMPAPADAVPAMRRLVG